MKYILIGVGVLVVLELVMGVSVLGFITNKALTTKPGSDGPTTPTTPTAQA